MNTSHSTPRRSRAFGLLAVAALLCAPAPARALDGARAVSQYVHRHWGTEDGFTGGRVHAITQTSDGYLWIGTDSGLTRFDGIAFQTMNLPVSMPSGAPIPVLGLEPDNDGSLWIRLQGPYLLHYSAGTFQVVIPNPIMTDIGLTAMCHNPRGGVVAASLSYGIVEANKTSAEVRIHWAALGHGLPVSMVMNSGGEVWLGTLGSGLLRANLDRAQVDLRVETHINVYALLPVSETQMWLGTDHGLSLWNGSAITQAGIPPILTHQSILAMLRDRGGNLWLSTAQGLTRFNSGGVESLEIDPEHSSNSVSALFEDREGNLWVGGTNGIDQLRDGTFLTWSKSQGLLSDANGSLYVDTADRAWVAPMSGGLQWVRGGQSTTVHSAGLDGDVVYSIDGRGSDVWVGRQRGGLTRLRMHGESIDAKIFTQANGLAQNSVYSVRVGADGSAWAGTLSGGVSHYTGDRFTTFTAADGLPSNTVSSIEQGRDGTMWFATPSGLAQLSEATGSGPRWKTWSTRDGLPSDEVISLLEDSGGVLWVGTGAGLATITDGSVHVPHTAPAALRGPVFGIAADRRGSLWVATSSHILRVNREGFLRDALTEKDIREYRPEDGLHGLEGVRRDRSVVADRLGRIWISANRGVSMTDPEQDRGSSIPAIAQIESLAADGSPVSLLPPATVPPGRRRVAFRYTGLSLGDPNRVRFRYMLEGFDHDWSDPQAAREAAYTNLPPGRYRFRLIASNSEGMWNGSEASLAMEMAPAFWQTWWFRICLVLAFACILLAIWRVRMLQVSRELQLRFDERLAERMRIAQALHDTLLQGFLSASMQLHVAVERVPADSAAQPLLRRVLALMGQVIDEGRTALRGLRSAAPDTLDLEHAFSRIPQEMAHHPPVAFRVIVDGSPRPVRLVIRDEVYRVGREALINALRHARAQNIDVQVEYGLHSLRVTVRDDGSGIDQQVLRSGREGHWGLSGMRERAERIGGRLKVWNRASGGTEVELIVPAIMAFENAQRPNRALDWLSRRLRPRRPESPQI